MRLRSNRETTSSFKYFPEFSRKIGGGGTVVSGAERTEVARNSRRKRCINDKSGRPRKKPRTDQLRNSEDVATTSKKVEVFYDTTRTRGLHKCLMQQETPHISNISDLPCHLLVKIFELLPIIERIKAERVCRLWHYLARNFSWTKTNVFSYPALIKQDDCSSYRCLNERPCVENAQIKSLMLRCGRYIRTLDLHAFRDSLTYAVCSSFASYCPMLRSLSLYGIQLTNSSLRLLGRHCFELEDVNFYRCFQESVVERGLTSFFSKCNKLKTVDIGGNERLTGVPSFSVLSSSIVSMKFSCCYRLSIEAMHHLRRRCPQLKTLVMSGIDSFPATELNSFFVSLEELRKLKFGECFISRTIGGADLNLGPLKNLVELTVNDNLLITDRVLRSVANNCKQLKFMDLSGCNRFVTEQGLLELAKLPMLAYLNLSMLRITSDVVIKKITEKGLLKVLLLHRCDGVTDEGLCHALKYCKKLSCLDVSFCPKITDVSMEEMQKFVLEREKREANEPVFRAEARRKHDSLVLEMLKLERGLRGLFEADIERRLPRPDMLNYQLNPLHGPMAANSAGGECSSGNNGCIGGPLGGDSAENSEGYTELHVWLGHSGITQPCRSSHRLLKIDETASITEQTTSTIELRVVIRIN